MFWGSFVFARESAIDDILGRESFTLENLLDEEDIFRELKAQNKKLIEYLSKPEPLKQIVSYVTKEPDVMTEPRKKLKYPSTCCELLESPPLSELLYENPELLNELFSVFDKPPPLSSLASNYSVKILTVLLGKKVGETVKFLKQRENILQKILLHLGNPGVREFLLKLIACQETREGQEALVLEWISEQNLIGFLVQSLCTNKDVDALENVSKMLSEIVSFSSSSGGQTFLPLMSQLENEETLKLLLNFVLGDTSPNYRQYGLQVIIELLKKETNKIASSQAESLPTISLIISNMEKLVDLLSDKSGKQMNTTTGVLSPPLSFHRLLVMEFFLYLVKTKSNIVYLAAIEHNLISRCLDLFFYYEWNSFLHASVEKLIHAVLQSDNNHFILSMFSKSQIAERIAKAAQDDEENSKTGKFRRGYMGYVTLISTAIQSYAVQNPDLVALLNQNESWKKYIDETYKNNKQREIWVNKPEGSTVDFEDDKSSLLNQFGLHSGYSSFSNLDLYCQDGDDDEDEDDEHLQKDEKEYFYDDFNDHVEIDEEGDDDDNGNRGGSGGDDDDDDGDEDLQRVQI